MTGIDYMKERKKWILWGVLLTVALFLIVFGLVRGGFQDVMNKATLICLECIGIG